MPRYKPIERHSLMLAVDLDEQIVPGSYAFALDYLVDHELDLSARDARFNNDEVGASAYDPRVMLKIVLLAYSRGLVSSRVIERACERDVQFVAISGDNQPSHARIAKFVSGLGDQIKPLFAQVLMICDAQGLIGREMFAIDGVKQPFSASKERSGTHGELLHRAERLERAANKIVAEHQAQDNKSEQGLPRQRQRRVDELSAEARRMRVFVAERAKRLNAKGREIKSNVTDQDSAKMATSKGLIPGYAAQAAVDNAMRQRDERFKGQGRYKPPTMCCTTSGPESTRSPSFGESTSRTTQPLTATPARPARRCGAGGAGVCQHPAQQAAAPVQSARQGQGEHAVAPVLPGAPY